ncbi:unnamed protein product [Rhizopus stolonifer]
MDIVSRRLLKELREIEKEASAHPEIIELAPESDENMLCWKAILAGLPDTPYEGGQFELFIQTGEICLDILKTAWSPAWTLKSTLLAISLLLTNPEPSSPLNCDAANLLRCNDKLGYNSIVKMYTQLYATGQK